MSLGQRPSVGLADAAVRLADLERDPGLAATLSPDCARALLSRLVPLQTALLAAALAAPVTDTAAPSPLVGIEEAAARLHTSVDSLHRRWKQLPFAFKDPLDGKLKFTTDGIEKYIRSRAGRS